jgi:hypothetical protein
VRALENAVWRASARGPWADDSGGGGRGDGDRSCSGWSAVWIADGIAMFVSRQVERSFRGGRDGDVNNASHGSRVKALEGSALTTRDRPDQSPA